MLPNIYELPVSAGARSFFSENRVKSPRAPHVRPLASQVPEQLGVRAPSVFERSGKLRQTAERSLFVDIRRHFRNCEVLGGHLDGTDRAPRCVEDVAQYLSLCQSLVIGTCI